MPVKTLSKDRDNYILHPPTGEKLSPESIETLKKLRDSWGANLPKGQIVISDGLNAKAIMDEGHLAPYLEEIGKILGEASVPMSEKNIVVTSGRVRAGYEIGQLLFEKADPNSLQGDSAHHRRTAGNHASLLFGLYHGSERPEMERKESGSRCDKARLQHCGYGFGTQSWRPGKPSRSYGKWLVKESMAAERPAPHKGEDGLWI